MFVFKYTCSLFGRCVYTFSFLSNRLLCTQVFDRSQWFGIPKNKRIPSQKLTARLRKWMVGSDFLRLPFGALRPFRARRSLLVSGSDVLSFPAPIQPWKCWGWKVTRQLEDRWHIHGWISCLETLFFLLGRGQWGGGKRDMALWMALKGPESRVVLWMFPNMAGFPPKSSHFNGGFHYKPSILGYPYFGKHPYRTSSSYSLMESNIHRLCTLKVELCWSQPWIWGRFCDIVILCVFLVLLLTIGLSTEFLTRKS